MKKVTLPALLVVVEVAAIAALTVPITIGGKHAMPKPGDALAGTLTLSGK